MASLTANQLAELRSLPGMAQLLPFLVAEPGVYLVGGAVRDLLIGQRPFDIDFAVEGDAARLAERLANELAGTVKIHQQFGTATLTWGGFAVDLAGTRSEQYILPGSLPTVKPAPLTLDLARRDFTINAIAVALSKDRLGELIEYPGATLDLEARLVRVMHDDSFVDDPTRLLRLLRYGVRLGFTVERNTEELARSAIEANAMTSVSGPRIRDELLDLLQEQNAVAAIDAMHELGLDHALHRRFVADEYVAARALLLVAEAIRQDLLLLASCALGFEGAELTDWLTILGLRRNERRIVSDAVMHAPELAESVAQSERPSEVAKILRGHALETAVLAAALPQAGLEVRERVQAWLAARTEQTLLVRGSDLLAAGIAPGPQIGRALAAVAARAIDGELTDKAGQLEAACACARKLAEED